MTRWLEEVEIRYGDFLRLLRSLKYTRDSWVRAANRTTDAGRRSYCFKQGMVL